jgi:hypothetical protein
MAAGMGGFNSLSKYKGSHIAPENRFFTGNLLRWYGAGHFDFIGSASCLVSTVKPASYFLGEEVEQG